MVFALGTAKRHASSPMISIKATKQHMANVGETSGPRPLLDEVSGRRPEREQAVGSKMCRHTRRAGTVHSPFILATG